MQTWKPKNFDTEYPSPEEGCAFVLGGSLHGEIMQENPLPRYFEHAVSRARDWAKPPQPNEIAATIETYRLEKFLVGSNQRTVWFYVHESELTDFWLIKAFTDLCLFKRDSFGRRAPKALNRVPFATEQK